MNRWGKRPVRTIRAPVGGQYAHEHACIRPSQLGDHLAVDVFVRKEDAFDALNDAVSDEPAWGDLLYVQPIELDERDVSPN
jgi:hypothetical protein